MHLFLGFLTKHSYQFRFRSFTRCYLQQLCGGCSIFWVFHQTLFDEVLKRLRPQIRVPECWRRVGGNHEDGLETQLQENRNTQRIIHFSFSLTSLYLAPSNTKTLHTVPHPHGMYVSVGRLSLRHLYDRYSQRPDVSHTVVADLLYDLWGHPERRADDRVSLRHGVLRRRWRSSKPLI